MERGGVIFRSQEQLRGMCCIDHKLEHLLRGSRVFRYVFCFGRKAAKLQVFCENDPEVSVELLKQFGPPPVQQMATNSTLGSASTNSCFFQHYNYLDVGFQPVRCRPRRCCSPTLTIGTLQSLPVVLVLTCLQRIATLPTYVSADSSHDPIRFPSVFQRVVVGNSGLLADRTKVPLLLLRLFMSPRGLTRPQSSRR
jgi:hypothetical protein